KDTPYEQRDHGWCVGYAPAETPQIAVAVIVEHGGFGAEAAAPVAREVIRAYLKKSVGKPVVNTGLEPEVKASEINTTQNEIAEEPDIND
ncbi:MAG: penicillin-binding transpeptidase domain-containing protein, partial [Deltaproteobacteria bacterium]